MAALTTEVTLKRDNAFFAYRMSFDKSTSLTAGYKINQQSETSILSHAEDKKYECKK